MGLCGGNSDDGCMSPRNFHLVLVGLHCLRSSVRVPAPGAVTLTRPAHLDLDGLGGNFLLGQLGSAACAPAARGLVVRGRSVAERDEVRDAFHLRWRERRGGR